MSNSNDDTTLLKKLAYNMIKSPRATLKELAIMSDISKATLYRIYGTRENLEKILFEKGNQISEDIVAIVNKEYIDYTEGLKSIIQMHFHGYEFIYLLCSFPCEADEQYQLEYDIYLKALDNFFLRGQEKGNFRIDLNASFLTEIFVSGIFGLLDAQTRGRIAKMEIEEHFLLFFLNGIELRR